VLKENGEMKVVEIEGVKEMGSERREGMNEVIGREKCAFE
jgi:hypothetical protein